MSGGGSMLKGLREFLVGDLGIEVELANPFQGSGFAGKMPEDNIVDAAPAFVMSLGLAAWEKSDIDLLGQRKAMRDSGPVKSLVAPGVVAVIIILLLYWNVSSKLAEARAELNKKTREIASLSPASATVLKLSSKKRKLEAELNSIPQALRESIDHARILEEIRLSTPDNTNLEKIVVDLRPGEKMIKIRGTAFFLDERGAAISDFMAVLEDSPLFDDVRMLNADDDKHYTKSGLSFQLSCQYNFTGG
jgi:Tfp pilus assembly protein PilN